jgi:hypothetical protein
MKTKQSLSNDSSSFRSRSAQSQRGLIAQLKRVRQAIEHVFALAPHAQQRLVRLALNEAEALAWQTPFPHLLFPALAEEKLNAVAAWQARQQLVKHNAAEMAFAA